MGTIVILNPENPEDGTLMEDTPENLSWLSTTALRWKHFPEDAYPFSKSGAPPAPAPVHVRMDPGPGSDYSALLGV